MRRSQLILLLTCLGITFALFTFGKRGLTVEEALAAKAEKKAEAQNESNEEGKRINFTEVIANVKTKLKKAQADSLGFLGSAVEEAEKPEQKLAALEDLADFWKRQGFMEIAAHYYVDIAELENTAEKWNRAGETNAISFKMARDSALVQHYVDKSIKSFEKALSLQPDNLDYKIGVATGLIDGRNEVMQGVMMLRDVTTTDSLNTRANLILARLAIVSGQFDKAERRLKIVTKQDPENAEAFYYLGEALANSGKKEEAAAAFEDCKKLVNSESFSSELDDLIEKMLDI